MVAIVICDVRKRLNQALADMEGIVFTANAANTPVSQPLIDRILVDLQDVFTHVDLLRQADVDDPATISSCQLLVELAELLESVGRGNELPATIESIRQQYAYEDAATEAELVAMLADSGDYVIDYDDDDAILQTHHYEFV